MWINHLFVKYFQTIEILGPPWDTLLTLFMYAKSNLITFFDTTSVLLPPCMKKDLYQQHQAYA